ncbi:hypothetical protein EF888_02305 [Silicimonas algicola]|nr:hypothetical protein EF888_02305 [Silicimonas algicola]
MASPNPLGRPKGVLDKRTKVTRALMDDAPAVARVVIDAAMEGDMTAAGLVLSRCAPVIKSQAERVQFELNRDAPLAEQARQIMQAVANGEVDPDTGRILIGCLSSVAGIEAVTELERRILELESREVKR